MRRSSVAIVIAVVAGERAGICMIPLPMWICASAPQIQPIGVTASAP